MYVCIYIYIYIYIHTCIYTHVETPRRAFSELNMFISEQPRPSLGY